MAEDDSELEIKGLDALLKALKRPPPTIMVGILGGSSRSDGKSNASVGAAHEFGAPKANIPKRSFLREPLADHLNDRLESSGAIDKDSLKEVIKAGSLLAWAQKVAIVAEAIVQEAFASGGFGKWKSLKSKTLSRKKVKQILVETTQLRNSITSEVKE